MNLFPEIVPPSVPGIDLRCCSIDEILDGEPLGASVVIADPPWSEYDNAPGVVDPNLTYQTLPLGTIGDHLEASGRHCLSGRLAVWHCWPLLAVGLEMTLGTPKSAKAKEKAHEWRRVLRPFGWEVISGGSWVKTGNDVGVGYHWLGRSEPVLLYVRGSGLTKDTDEMTPNGWASVPGNHSVKPLEWTRSWIRRWTRESDTVLDFYAGEGTVAIACALERRRYVGAEIDPGRHAIAMGKIRRALAGAWVE